MTDDKILLYLRGNRKERNKALSYMLSNRKWKRVCNEVHRRYGLDGAISKEDLLQESVTRVSSRMVEKDFKFLKTLDDYMITVIWNRANYWHDKFTLVTRTDAISLWLKGTPSQVNFDDVNVAGEFNTCVDEICRKLKDVHANILRLRLKGYRNLAIAIELKILPTRIRDRIRDNNNQIRKVLKNNPVLAEKLKSFL